jgi:hypothetical protein
LNADLLLGFHISFRLSAYDAFITDLSKSGKLTIPGSGGKRF